ncbi:MAG TPA: nuclear transport factor 2 family protein [Streptosporangiaceae bacterium]|jgi:ketosteroid isomerase-like protein
MAHPNEDLVRRGFDAYSRGDVQALLTEFLSPDVVWHIPGRGPLAGDHAGLEAVAAHFGRVAELSGSTHRVELHDVVGNDNHVVALHAARAERGGKRLDLNALHLFHVRDGMITEAWTVHHDLYAWDDFWA